MQNPKRAGKSLTTRVGNAPRTDKIPTTRLLLGIAAGVAVIAGLSRLPKAQPARRYADRGVDRRSPLSLFTPGLYLRRRTIDYSGSYPLFERRQGVYESY